MAIILPFKSLRPVKDKVKQVASPPYDVLDSKEAKTLVNNNPHSFLHVVKPEIDLSDGVDLYSREVYEKGAQNLKILIKNQIMKKDSEKYFYLYRQKMGNHYQTGLVACASTEDYMNDIIKKHEFTRKDKEDDRTRHVEYLNANTGPVFLTYYARQDLDNLFEKIVKTEPEYKFISEEDNVQHEVWIIKELNIIEKIKQIFKEIPALYVADGHHRSASATRVAKKRKEANKNHTGNEEYNGFLSVIFPHNQMYIMAYNRIVKDLNNNTEKDFMDKLSKIFKIEKTDIKKPSKRHKFCMYMDKQWYLLTALSHTYEETDPLKSLDVAILQNFVLDPILDIKDPRKSKRIDFVGGIRGTKELEKRIDNKEGVAAFSLFPTSIEELIKIADSGNVMPPKSTWFEPKLKSGLFVHLLDD